MKTKILLFGLLVLGLIFFPYIIITGVIFILGAWGVLAFCNLFYMIFTGKGKGNYDSLN
ncbi:hypothetical protein PG291_01920 [Riemerella anatipestifer]|nr:hypothetical protein [Riemerella anatipestifer]